MGGSRLQRLLTRFALGLLVLSGTSVAADLRQGIDDCVAIENDAERLACFDALASTTVERKADEGTRETELLGTPASVATDQVPTSADTPAQSGQNIVPERIVKDDEVFAVRLTRCTDSSGTNRQVYYFDNGEVWRQSNSSRKKIKNCDTPVTIKRGALGYKMHVESEGRSIRIRPVR